MITPYIDFKYIKGRDNILADSLLRLKTLRLYEVNDPEEPGERIWQVYFDRDLEIVCDVDINQHSNREFEIKGVKFLIDEKDTDDLPLRSKDEYYGDHIHSYITKVKQLQQDTHINYITTKFQSRKWDKTLYFLDEHGIIYRKIKDESNIFHSIMVPQTLEPYILYMSYNALGHNCPTCLHSIIKRHYYWRKLCQHCNRYVRSCPNFQQLTLKEPHNVDIHLPIPQFPMTCVSMDILGPYQETENGNLHSKCYVYVDYLCLHDSHQIKTTEEVIKDYLKNVYSVLKGS